MSRRAEYFWKAQEQRLLTARRTWPALTGHGWTGSGEGDSRGAAPHQGWTPGLSGQCLWGQPQVPWGSFLASGGHSESEVQPDGARPGKAVELL